jgi:hypothetical protein
MDVYSLEIRVLWFIIRHLCEVLCHISERLRP